MSLIIAKIINDKIYIESDSKVTDKDAVKNDPLCGLLKTVILHPCICISFAGKIYYAESALKEIFELKEFTLNDILELLLKFNIKSKNETDFIVAFIQENRAPLLFKVSNCEIENNLKSVWIGDIEGFKIFQKNFLTLKGSGMDDVLCLQRAFKAVIDDDNIPSVGNFQISIHTDENICPINSVFLYTEKIEISVCEPQTIHIENAGEWKSISLGTDSGGSFGISYLVSVSPNLHGVAIHFTHGNFGVIFCPQISFAGIIENNVNGLEFVNIVKDKYEIPLRGFIKSDSTKVQFVDTSN